LLQAEQVILPPVSGQLLSDLLLGFAAASVTQLRQLLGIAFAGSDGAQDGHSRHPIDVESPLSATRLALSRTRVRSMHTASSGRNEPRSSPK
jgi:hypothetical protein